MADETTTTAKAAGDGEARLAEIERLADENATPAGVAMIRQLAATVRAERAARAAAEGELDRMRRALLSIRDSIRTGMNGRSAPGRDEMMDAVRAAFDRTDAEFKGTLRLIAGWIDSAVATAPKEAP